MNFFEWFFLEKGRAAAGLFSWSHLLSVALILGAFIAIGGLLMGFMGNYFAGNIYEFHPAFSYLSLISAFGHSFSASAALFVFVPGLNKMEKRNIPFVIGILFVYLRWISDACGYNPFRENVYLLFLPYLACVLLCFLLQPLFERLSRHRYLDFLKYSY